MFQMSSDDKESEGKRLSIWVEELTIADQAWEFMGARPECDAVACLCVDRIRLIPSQPGFDPPRVEWEQAFTRDTSGSRIPNNRPGAEGHCGITGLDQGGDGKTHSRQRKAMRSDLADLAELSPVPARHEIPEEQLEVAAYFIYENNKMANESAESNWIEAIRQLRRALVGEHRSASPAK